MAETLEDAIHEVLLKPIGSNEREPEFGFEALERDGSTKLGLSGQVLAAMARATLTRCIPGAIFNEITAHCDENAQLKRVEVEYMDEIHDPSSRRTIVLFSQSTD